MQKIFKGILSLVLAVAVCLGTAAIFGVTQYKVADAAAGNYYNKITATGGTALLGQLHDLIVETHTTYTSYDDCKGTKVNQTDPGPNGVGVMDFYTQTSITKFSGTVGTWNREHVWCQSLSGGLWGTSGGGSDMHHIRPSEAKINSNRGNNKYGVVGSHSASNEEWSYNTSGGKVALGGYSSGSTFEPLDNVKGDVARIVMYVYTHYNNASNVGGTKESAKTHGNLPYTNVISASSEAAAVKMLLEWNKLDPVDQIEITRNEAVYKIQGNRNPFIDNSSYAEAIWGGGAVVDPPVNPNPVPSDTLQSIRLNATSLNLSVGDMYNITVTPTPSNASASVIWSSSNENVATVSGGKIVAKATGTATITATSSVNTSIKATATVTVTHASSSETSVGKVIITRDSFKNTTGGYDTFNWSYGTVSGTGYIYGGEKNKIQFNTSKDSQYIASDKPTGGAIKKVTIEASGNSEWTLLTSTVPYDGITSGNPSHGNAHDMDEATDGSWVISGNDTYFALVLSGKGAGYIHSIEVEYASAGGSEPTGELKELLINPSAFELAEGESAKLGVLCIPSNASTEVSWTSSNPSVATVSADGTVTAIKAGTATITATSKTNSAITATATVTVTEAPFASDSESATAFHNAVEAINANGTFTTWRSAIKTAINLYKGLSAEDKTEVAADIARLNSAIESYNEKIKTYNDANEIALKGAGVFL